jgi:hypothetical protein
MRQTVSSAPSSPNEIDASENEDEASGLRRLLPATRKIVLVTFRLFVLSPVSPFVPPRELGQRRSRSIRAGCSALTFTAHPKSNEKARGKLGDFRSI